MNYKIIPGTEAGGSVVLQRTRKLQFFLVALFLLVGAPMGFAGALLFLAGSERYAPFFFAGMGALFLGGGYMLAVKIRMPETMVFDNGRGILTIREAVKDGAAEAVIPYGDISGFTAQGDPGSRGKRYSVVMTKRDGAFWSVYTDSSYDRAAAFRKTLNENVRLMDYAATEAPQREPARFAVTRDSLSTSISWRDRHPVSGSLFVLVIVGAMGMILFGAWPWITSIVAYAVAVVFISVIGVLVLYNTVYSIGKIRSVTVSGAGLLYAETGGPVPGRSFSVPLTDIAAVTFNFSVSQNDSVIYIVRKHEKAYFDAYSRQALSPGDIMKTLKAMMKMKRINAMDLSTVEKMDLEYLIQNAVAERGGIRGL